MPNKLWDNTEMNVIVSIDPWMTSDEYRNVISPGLQTECHQPWTPDGVWSALDSRRSVISPGLQMECDQPWTPDDEIYCDSKFIGGGNQSASHWASLSQKYFIKYTLSCMGGHFSGDR